MDIGVQGVVQLALVVAYGVYRLHCTSHKVVRMADKMARLSPEEFEFVRNAMATNRLMGSPQPSHVVAAEALAEIDRRRCQPIVPKGWRLIRPEDFC